MRRRSKHDEESSELPASVTDYVGRLVRMIGYRRKVRREVKRELLGHFADALRDCPSAEEANTRAEQLIDEFGDPELLAALCRRAKKRCRPLWLKAVGGTRMAIFLLVTGLSSYTAMFVSGKPVVTDEYLMELNQINRPLLPATDSAWPHYKEAFSLFVEPSKELKETLAFKSSGVTGFKGLSAISGSEQKAISEWVAANEPSWARLETASHYDGCWRPYRYDRGLPKAPPLIEVTANCLPRYLRDLAKVGVWKARLATEDGRLGEALDHSLVIARLGAHWQRSAGMVEQLIGVGLGALGRHELRRIVSQCGLPAATDRKSVV